MTACPAMVFTGEYRHRIDKKRRISLPAPYREMITHIPDNLYMLPYTDTSGCLYLGRMQDVFNLAAKNTALETLAPFIIPLGTIDRDGRITLSNEMMHLCGFKTETSLVITGHGRYFALRTADNWNALKPQLLNTLKKPETP